MDEILFRSLKNGSQYNSLFPNTTCEKVALGKGDTDYSIDKMVDWILLHQNQTTKVAALLEKSSLQNTCKSNHDFLFNHFQYKADLEDQLLRSPACAWKQRYDGIDCKSYSIIASCLLLNQGINHYIRKVAYTTPGEYTHVYVIVPTNQKTNDLNDGYYMIDGTINTMQEPNFLEEKDEFMSLNHYGLNNPIAPRLNGVNFSFLKKINFNNLQGLFSNIRCWGGSAYNTGLFDANINKLTEYVNGVIESLNRAISENDMVTLANDYSDLLGDVATFHQGHGYVRAFGDWNPCTDENLRAFEVPCNYFLNVVHPALTAYLDQYFTRTQEGVKNYTNVGLEAEGWTFMEIEGHVYSTQVTFFKFTRKDFVRPIPAFEFTQPLIDAAAVEGAQVDIPQLLSTFQNIIWSVAPNGGNNGNPNNGTGTVGSYDASGQLQPTTTSKFGLTTVAGFALLAGALMVAFNKTPNAPASKRKTQPTKAKA